MAAVKVTIIGTLTHQGGTQESVTVEGMANLTDLSIGGGPIIPPTPPLNPPPHPAHPIVPPGGYPHPEHPIVLPPYPPGVPTHPIVLPPDPGDPAHPAHPIVIPDPPIDVPPDTPPGTVVKPPPATGGWGFIVPYGWAYFPMGSGPGPK